MQSHGPCIDETGQYTFFIESRSTVCKCPAVKESEDERQRQCLYFIIASIFCILMQDVSAMLLRQIT